MAGDIRDPSSPAPPPHGPPPGATSPPDHIKAGGTTKIYEVFNGPPPSANALPEGSGQNTAGANTKPPSFTEAIKTVRWEELKNVHLIPCARESFLTGIAAGFGMGGIRALWGAPIPRAANWAVGSFAIAALANWEYCQQKRRIEKTAMKKAVDIIDRKKKEKEEIADAKRKERRRLKEEEDRLKEEKAKRGSWKFW